MKIGVLGAGQMGSGIAQVCLSCGFDVVLNDIGGEILAKARENILKGLDILVRKERLSPEGKERAISGLVTSTDPGEFGGCGFVIEAATEREDLKLSLFRKLDAIVSPGGILATNTSSISITRIAAATKRPESVIGMHFMNPVPLMKLVEVIRGLRTSEETFAATVELTRKLGKEPVPANDSPGFIADDQRGGLHAV